MKNQRLIPFMKIITTITIVAAIFAILPTHHSHAYTRHEKILKDNRQDLDRIAAYLNSIKYFTTSFIQRSPGGEVSEGTFYLSRPGKMRIEYSPPVPILIVVNGRTLIYQDIELEEISHIKTSSTPASFLTRKRISFDASDVEITDFKKRSKSIRVSVIKKKKRDTGEFTLVFEANPLKLRKMEVKDEFDQITQVSFYNEDFKSPIKNSIFKIQDPRLPK